MVHSTYHIAIEIDVSAICPRVQRESVRESDIVQYIIDCFKAIGGLDQKYLDIGTSWITLIRDRHPVLGSYVHRGSWALGPLYGYAVICSDACDN